MLLYIIDILFRIFVIACLFAGPKILDMRMLLGPGIIAGRERANQSKVKHLQWNYCNKLGYGLRV